MTPGRLRIDPFSAFAAAVFAGFVAYYGLCCFRTPWAGDFQLHCAGVAQLYRDLLHPSHEAMNVPGTLSTVYTPYLVGVAALGRLAGVTPYRALQLAGVLNLVLYVAGLRFFVSRHSLHWRTGLATAVLLLVTLYLRWNHYGWSSETSLLSFQLVQSYPSTAGWAMAFFSFGLVEDLHRRPRPLRILALAALLWLLLLSHVLTASWVIIMIALRGLFLLARDRDWRLPVLLAVSIGAALALATVWPYSSFWDQARLVEVRVAAPFGQHPFADFPNLYLVAIPCAAWLLARRRRHLFPVIAFFASFAALKLGNALGIGFANRYSLFMCFWAQFLVAEVATAGIVTLLRAPDPSGAPPAPARFPALDRALPVVLLAATALAWLPAPMWRQDSRRGAARLLSPWSLWRQPSTHDQYYARLGGLGSYLHRGDVVLMPVDRSTFDVASVTGAQVVASPNALWAPGFMGRVADVLRFLSADTPPGIRLEIASRYHANKVLLGASDPALAGVEQTFGPAVHRDQAWALFEVRPP